MRNQKQSTPRKTRMAFNVGIAGHIRLNEADTERLTQQINDILREIKKDVTEEYEGIKDLHIDQPPILRMICMLAEGSDRIAAKCALEQQYTLQCPLPMKKEEYLKDFVAETSKYEFNRLLEQADSVFEIEACAKNRNRAYQNGGQVMLSQIDLLIAVWNGMDSGKVGGTSDVVELARHQDIPIVWISSKEPHEISFLYGELMSKSWQDEMKKAVDQILLPWDIDDKEKLFPYAYYQERISNRDQLNLYNHLKFLLSYPQSKKAVPNKTRASGKDKFYTDNYFSHYTCADSYAQYYRDNYRSSGIIRQLLPFLASIGLALGFYVSLVGGPDGSPPTQKLVLDVIGNIGFILQGICFVLIILMGHLEKKFHWHQKFSDYRALAELLRQMVYLGPAGLVVRGLRAPAFNRNVNVSWINWQFRAIAREAGLPSGRIDEQKLGDLVKSLRGSVIQSQLLYHQDNVNKMDIISKRLEGFGLQVYYIGVLIVLLRVVVHIITSGASLLQLTSGERGYISTFFNMLSMVVPLFSAVALGLSSQEGFPRIKQLSEVMCEKLQLLSDQISGTESDYYSFMKFSQATADLMLSEFTDWNVFFKSKTIKDN